MPSNAASLSQSDVDAARVRAMHRVGGAPPEPVRESRLSDGVDALCPFGCDSSEMTEIGHCRHLVGFSSNGTTFEPQRQRMRPAREADGKIIRDDNGVVQMEWDGTIITDGRYPEMVQPGDVLVRTGVSSRVYRQKIISEPVPVEIGDFDDSEGITD
jgi:hypothetical protein